MRKTSPLTILLAVLLLMLAACSPATTPSSAPSTQPEPTAEIIFTDAPTATSEPVLEALPTAEPTTASEPEPIVLTDGLGREITLLQPAQKVISLAASNTELLFAIGAGDSLVGRDTFSDFPAAALAAPDIGGGFAPLDTETILASEPDIVLAADITPSEQIQELEDLGLTVFSVPNPLEFSGLFANLHTVGLLTGHEVEAGALVEVLETRVTTVLDTVAQAESMPVVFYQLDSTDPNAPWTAGPGNFIDTMLSLAGGSNVGASLDSPWVQISVEALIVANPQIILVGDFTWGGVTAADVIARPGWEVMTAVQNGQVYEFDDNLVSRPGPRLVDGLEQLATLLHPDLFD